MKSAYLEDNKLVIELDEVEAKVVEKIFPVLRHMLQMYIGIMVRASVLIVSQGKEGVRPYLDRLSRGEDTGSVIREMLTAWGVPIENFLPDIKPPSDDEIRKVLRMLGLE